MAKRRPQYMDRLYVARVERGKNSPNWQAFYLAVSDLNGKSPDFGGITSAAVVSSHHDKLTLRAIVTSDMDDGSDVSVEEITALTLNGDHRPYTSLVETYFLPFKSYPNIGSR